jgi:hypothetical protein
MTMKRILQCTLIFMVLVTSGCGWWPGASDSTAQQNTGSQPSPQVENNKIDFTGAERNVRAAITKLKSPNAATTVKLVKDDIFSANQKLREDERARCTDCTEETKNGAAEVSQTLAAISSTLTDPQQKIASLGNEAREKLQKELSDQATKLKELSTADPKSIETAASAASSEQTPPQTETDGDPWWWSIIVLALQVVGGLLVLVLIAGVLTYLWKRAWKTVEFNVGQVVAGHVAATREAQPDYAPKLSSLSSAQAEMSSRLTELDTEVRSLARLVRESLATRRPDRNSPYGGGGFNYHSPVEDPAPKDEAEFPVSAVDYLGKMNRFANVVRPDFQNGILVNDPDGTGELVLIRDSRDETQPLFVVPRATQFQTKQDFYTYYQKYYDCVRPSAGDVWIIGPAVVEKVAGGWQLREKGMLEVR